jgi:hypothetical protein
MHIIIITNNRSKIHLNFIYKIDKSFIYTTNFKFQFNMKGLVKKRRFLKNIFAKKQVGTINNNFKKK